MKRQYEQMKSEQVPDKPKMLLGKLSEAFTEKGHSEKEFEVICKVFGKHERMGELLREVQELVREQKKPPPPQEVNVLLLLARKEGDRAAKQGLPHAARLSANGHHEVQVGLPAGPGSLRKNSEGQGPTPKVAVPVRQSFLERDSCPLLESLKATMGASPSSGLAL